MRMFDSVHYWPRTFDSNVCLLKLTIAAYALVLISDFDIFECCRRLSDPFVYLITLSMWNSTIGYFACLPKNVLISSDFLSLPSPGNIYVLVLPV